MDKEKQQQEELELQDCLCRLRDTTSQIHIQALDNYDIATIEDWIYGVYRKAEEVRKETAKEIIERVREKYHRQTFLTDSWLDDIEKEYGLEID